MFICFYDNLALKMSNTRCRRCDDSKPSGQIYNYSLQQKPLDILVNISKKRERGQLGSPVIPLGIDGLCSHLFFKCMLNSATCPSINVKPQQQDYWMLSGLFIYFETPLERSNSMFMFKVPPCTLYIYYFQFRVNQMRRSLTYQGCFAMLNVSMIIIFIYTYLDLPLIH